MAKKKRKTKRRARQLSDSQLRKFIETPKGKVSKRKIPKGISAKDRRFIQAARKIKAGPESQKKLTDAQQQEIKERREERAADNIRTRGRKRSKAHGFLQQNIFRRHLERETTVAARDPSDESERAMDAFDRETQEGTTHPSRMRVFFVPDDPQYAEKKYTVTSFQRFSSLDKYEVDHLRSEEEGRYVLAEVNEDGSRGKTIEEL